jgi:hypothetical protein
LGLKEDRIIEEANRRVIKAVACHGIEAAQQRERERVDFLYDHRA